MNFTEFAERFEKKSKTAKGFSVRCPSHEDKTASLSISEGRDGAILVKCFAGCRTEDVVAAMGLKMSDLFPEGARKHLSRSNHVGVATHQEKPHHGDAGANGGHSSIFPDNVPVVDSAPREKSEIETIYDYTDEIGRLRFQVVRMKPKTFRQRHRDESGKWIWTMQGVERVLYRLPEVKKNQVVVVCEGEKDADNLSAIGFCATTNVGGAGKWMDGYSESLKGKDVVICGDNDDAGRKHVTLIYDSISDSCKSVKIVEVPRKFKDISLWIESVGDADRSKRIFQEWIDDAVPHFGKVKLPLYSMGEMEAKYRRQVLKTTETMLDLGTWLPSLKRIRPIVPGELVLLIGATGIGKTGLLQNVAKTAKKSKLPTLLFEMELPLELVYERFLAMESRITCSDVEKEYRDNNHEIGGELLDRMFPFMLVCPETGLTCERLESLIVASELKIGKKPVLVLIDYVQIMRGEGTRYERTSTIAENLKQIAKRTETILIVASQISRPEKDSEGPVTLYSGKDSGSLENSAGLVLGAWRDRNDERLLFIKVLKCTKGGTGTVVECNFDGASMTISERSKITDEDIPQKTMDY